MYMYKLYVYIYVLYKTVAIFHNPLLHRVHNSVPMAEISILK